MVWERNTLRLALGTALVFSALALAAWLAGGEAAPGGQGLQGLTQMSASAGGVPLWLRLGLAGAAVCGLAFGLWTSVRIGGRLAALRGRLEGVSSAAALAGGDIFVSLERDVHQFVESMQAGEQEHGALLRRAREAEELAEGCRRGLVRAREQAEDARSQGLASAAETLSAALTGIEAAAATLRATSGAAGRAAESQRAAVAEAASAMAQMNASVTEAARGAAAAAESAGKAMRMAREGAGRVEETIRAIDAVSERADALGHSVSGLDLQAAEIGKIMVVISDIADQTNLLALNAAIEAARAGDAGRGFAVVADEVRKLAEKTMAATQDVGRQIGTIREGVAATRLGMDETGGLVRSTVETARRSGQAMEAIVALMSTASAETEAIAAAAGQQSRASEEIHVVIARVDRISEDTGRDMAESRQAMASLSAKLADLATLAQVFTLVGGGSLRRIIESLVGSADIRSFDRDRQEAALRRAARENRAIELLYVTDGRGRQSVANIPRPGLETPADAAALGRDWSDRPWFGGAMESLTIFVSPVYVSTATGRPCITVSAAIRDELGQARGVVAADVRVDV